MANIIIELLMPFLTFSTTAYLCLLKNDIRQLYVESFGFEYNEEISLDLVRMGIFVNLGAFLILFIYAQMNREERVEGHQDDNDIQQDNNHVPHIDNQQNNNQDHRDQFRQLLPLVVFYTFESIWRIVYYFNYPLIANHLLPIVNYIRFRLAPNNTNQDDDQIHPHDQLHQN